MRLDVIHARVFDVLNEIEVNFVVSSWCEEFNTDYVFPTRTHYTLLNMQSSHGNFLIKIAMWILLELNECCERNASCERIIGTRDEQR